MDKLKPIIAVMAKHVFWAGCGLILIVSVATWYMARGRLHEEFDKGLGDIKTKVSSVQSLKTKASQNPPNKYSHDGMDLLHDSTLEKVVEAWRKQYERQENEPRLQWNSRVLGDDFVLAVRDLKPIETAVSYPPTQEQKLSVVERQRYWNYVERLLPDLARLVGTRWAPTEASGGFAAPGGGPMAPATRAIEKPPIVVWEPQDQKRLMGTHFNWGEAPTTLQVLYAQEDLWVLTALAIIIAQTNGQIDSRHEAVVKSIESIMIGRGVTGRAGQVTQVGRGGMSGGMDYGSGGGGSPYGGEGGSMDMDMGMDGDGGDGGDGGELGEGTMGGSMPSPSSGSMGSDPGSGMGAMTGASGATRLTADPADGRYVDNNYETLRASKIRTAMTNKSPEDAFLVVAKRMPIRLRLVVDQRKLHRLLATCGNCYLPVEIRQVRLNRGKSSGGGGGYDMGGGGGYDMGGGMGDSLSGSMGLGGGYGGSMGESSYDEGDSMANEDYSTDTGGGYPSFGGGMGNFGSTMGDVKNRTQISSTTSHDVPVELYGIIYIYNPVDKELQDRLKERTQGEGLTGTVQPETGAPG